MPNKIKSFDGREALDEFLKAALPRANFVTRTSDKQFASSIEDITSSSFSSAQKRVFWKNDSDNVHAPIPFDGVPFISCGFRILDCRFGGERCHKAKSASDSTEARDTHAEAKSGGNGEPAADLMYAKAPPEEKKKRIKLQGTRKIGCEAMCNIRRILGFPDFFLDPAGLVAGERMRRMPGRLKLV